MDLIYLVREGDENDGLRYSLRSLVNYPNHGRIWVVGYKPTWLTDDVLHIPGNPSWNGHHNVYHNVLAACRHPETPKTFAIMNDDFYITAPVDEIPSWRREGTLTDQIMVVRGWWRQSLWHTRWQLKEAGIPEPVSYELHIPFVTNKHKMRTVLERYIDVKPNNPPQWRTLYGNLTRLPAVVHEDVKANDDGPIKVQFHSTAPDTFELFRDRLDAMFPTPSPWEQAPITVS